MHKRLRKVVYDKCKGRKLCDYCCNYSFVCSVITCPDFEMFVKINFTSIVTNKFFQELRWWPLFYWWIHLLHMTILVSSRLLNSVNILGNFRFRKVVWKINDWKVYLLSVFWVKCRIQTLYDFPLSVHHWLFLLTIFVF